MRQSLSSDSARARSTKQQKDASRRAAPDARERIPVPAERHQRFNPNQKQKAFLSYDSDMVLRSHLEKPPTDLPQYTCYFGDRTLELEQTFGMPSAARLC